MEKQSSFEKLSGNIGTQTALTTLAACVSLAADPVATPLVSLLPILVNSLAAGRHKERVEKAIREIEAKLLAHEDALQSLSDGQFKLLNEIVLAVLQTTEDEKLAYLKQAIDNGLSAGVDLGHSVQLSRMLRDIAAVELKFLIENFRYESIVFDANPDSGQELRVSRGDVEEVAVTGLIALGLVIPAGSTMDSMGKYRFSPLVEKLVILVQR
jgi:hypothetical protein